MTIMDTIIKARCASTKDGRLRFIFSPEGMISLRDDLTQKRYVTNGEKVWMYEIGTKLSPSNGKLCCE